MLKYFIEFFTLKIVYQSILTIVLGFVIYSLLKKGFNTIAIKGRDEL